jgi:hypothetical protein
VGKKSSHQPESFRDICSSTDEYRIIVIACIH